MNFYTLELPTGGQVQGRRLASFENPMERKYNCVPILGHEMSRCHVSPGPTPRYLQANMLNNDYWIGGTSNRNHFAPVSQPYEKPGENATCDDVVPIVPVPIPMDDLSSVIMNHPSWEDTVNNIWEKNLVNSIWDELLPDASVENESYKDKLPAASSGSSAGPLQSYSYFAPPTAKYELSPPDNEIKLFNSAPPLQRKRTEKGRPKFAKRLSKAKKGPSERKIKLYERDEEGIEDEDEKKKIKKAKRSKAFREKIKRLASHQCICCLLPKISGGELQELFKSILEGKHDLQG